MIKPEFKLSSKFQVLPEEKQMLLHKQNLSEKKVGKNIPRKIRNGVSLIK